MFDLQTYKFLAKVESVYKGEVGIIRATSSAVMVCGESGTLNRWEVPRGPESRLFTNATKEMSFERAIVAAQFDS